MHTLPSVLGSAVLGMFHIWGSFSNKLTVFDQCFPYFWLDLNLLMSREPILPSGPLLLPVCLSGISQEDFLGQISSL